MVHAIESFFLIEAYDSSRNVLVMNIVDGVSDEKKVFKDTSPRNAACLVLVN